MILRCRCHPQVVLEVEEEHRNLRFRPIAGPVPGCALLHLGHLALATPSDVLGPHGAWHPGRQGPCCDIFREDEHEHA